MMTKVEAEGLLRDLDNLLRFQDELTRDSLWRCVQAAVKKVTEPETEPKNDG